MWRDDEFATSYLLLSHLHILGGLENLRKTYIIGPHIFIRCEISIFFSLLMSMIL